jgi:glycosyltransferase involved in cell wall biosynthesis
VDRESGYPIFRAPDVIDAARAAAAQFQPDVFVVTEAGPWMARLPPIIGNVPTVIYEQDVSLGAKDVPRELQARALYVANSAATSANLLRECGIASTIVRPLFGVDQYAGIQRRGNSVLFVSLQHRKGSDVAISIARSRPRVPFVFIESWARDIAQTQALRQIVRRVANITLMSNQPGLGHIMPQIKLLLMPSRSQEAWGRTATEAQICGIPVLGSSRGNLPFTIGPGGKTLDPDEPIERWLEAFDGIMDDPRAYEELSRKALEHGRAFAQEVKHAYQTFEHVLYDAVARRQA